MAKFKIKSKGVLPPITSNKETLQVQFAITVPSTVLNREVKSEVFKKRADDVARYLADSFGGDTKVRGKGDYTSKGKLITDNVFIIEASSDLSLYLKKRKDLSEKIKRWREDWKQQQIFHTFEDKAYLYPSYSTVNSENKEGKFSKWLSQEEKIIKK